VYFPYSYYAGEGIARYGGQTRANLIFQVHPLGGYLRKLYKADMELQPAGRDSLLSEEEFRQQNRFQELIEQAPHLANGIICASSLTKASLLNAGVSCPISVVPYGVDINRFTPRTRPRVRGPLRLAFVGQISQRKGILHLLEAIRICGKEIELVIISRGNLRQEFSPFLFQVSYSHHKGLDDAATWEMVKTCHFLVLPSVAEGFGLVILESLACGVPVIASDCTGAVDVMTNGKEGYIVPSGSPTAIATALSAAASNLDLSEQMGLAARATAEKLTWDEFRSQITRHYSQLLT
jgi:glycosyltransferase involved in cell wall biosynthesis